MGQLHCKCISELTDARLVAVCDIAPDVAKSVGDKYGVPYCTDYHELIDRPDVDAVTIATPHYFHPEVAIYAMERGKPVLSEKPIAVNVSAADAMIATAKRTGVPFAVMFQSRTEPAWRAAGELVKAGKLGEIYRTLLVYADFRTQAYYDSAGWRATWSGEGGGVLMNQSPHALDRLTWLGGLPCKVTAYTATRNHKIEVEDVGMAMLEYPNGGIGFIHCSVNETPGTMLMEISGEKGKLRVITNPKGQQELTFWEVDPGVKAYSDGSGEMWSKPPATEVPIELPQLPQGHGEVLRNFTAHILNGEPLLTPGIEGINATELIDAMILSGKTGKPVQVPVDRAVYDAFLEKLKKRSRAKKTGPDKRITDTVNIKA
jgi:predicted dehydrogenase